MKNYRIIINNEFDFNFIKKYLIDNHIGGNLVSIQGIKPSPTYENLEYDETFKEVWIYTYPYGKVLNPYFQQFFDNENRTIMIFPNNSSNSENELLFQQFEKPISLSDFLSIETK